MKCEMMYRNYFLWTNSVLQLISMIVIFFFFFTFVRHSSGIEHNHTDLIRNYVSETRRFYAGCKLHVQIKSSNYKSLGSGCALL